LTCASLPSGERKGEKRGSRRGKRGALKSLNKRQLGGCERGNALKMFFYGGYFVPEKRCHK